MERTTGLEPVTSSLARIRTTNCTKSAFAPYPTAFSRGYLVPLYRPTERDSGGEASKWSDRWVTIPRHQPWEGCTLPTELLSHESGEAWTDSSLSQAFVLGLPQKQVHLYCEDGGGSEDIR